jgi:2-C-methyl-D-erythritol 4-phosphate cytidylyltransferase
MKTTAIIPAGGIGKRFGSDMPKQFTELNGLPIIIHTLKIFENTPSVTNIVIPVHNKWASMTKDLIIKNGIKKVKEIVIGGKERQDSVYNALHTKSVEGSDIVLVHDAVRPLTSVKLVEKIIAEAEEFGAVVPGIMPEDTIKMKTAAGGIVKTLDRKKLARIQTPQGFWQDLLITAYKKAYEANFIGTDSSALVEFIGYKVQLVGGEDRNLKITTPLDIKVAEMLLNEKSEDQKED